MTPSIHYSKNIFLASENRVYVKSYFQNLNRMSNSYQLIKHSIFLFLIFFFFKVNQKLLNISKNCMHTNPISYSPKRLSKNDFVGGRTSTNQLLDTKKLIYAKNAKTTNSSKALLDVPPMPAIKSRTLELNLPPVPRHARRSSDTRAVIVRPKPASRLSDEYNLTPEFLDRIRRSVSTMNKEQSQLRRNFTEEEEIREQLPIPRIVEYTVIAANGKPINC